VWDWLKENWKTVLLGVLTLGVGLVVGKSLRKTQNVVNPELVGADKTKREAQAEENKARLEAAKKRAERLVSIEEKHEQTIKKLTDEQRTNADELKDDPEKLNEYLFQVGKDIRG
jgi:F0F1-type ATP synthase membrane subunit b/b'